MILKVFVNIVVICGCFYPTDSVDICKTCYCSHETIETVPQLFVQCARKHLKQLPNDDFREAYEIDVSFNEITSLEGNTKLISGNYAETFKCSYNQISSISREWFEGVPNLIRLDLSRNRIGKFDSQTFDVLKRLRYLDLSFNSLQLNSVGQFLSSLTNLYELDLSYNNLSAVISSSENFFEEQLGVSKRLSRLKLDRVGLSHVPNWFFDHFVDLEYLSMADNNFAKIPSIPPKILHLDLSGNAFTELTIKDFGFNALKTLKLNRLKSLTYIHHYAFYNLQSLQELSLENCVNLKNFNSLTFGFLENGIELPLKKISLAGCALQSLNTTYFHLFTSLEQINLLNNPWMCNCDILWFKMLKKSTLIKHNQLL